MINKTDGSNSHELGIKQRFGSARHQYWSLLFSIFVAYHISFAGLSAAVVPGQLYPHPCWRKKSWTFTVCLIFIKVKLLACWSSARRNSPDLMKCTDVPVVWTIKPDQVTYGTPFPWKCRLLSVCSHLLKTEEKEFAALSHGGNTKDKYKALDLEVGSPACSRWVRARWSWRSFPTPDILWFYERRNKMFVH